MNDLLKQLNDLVAASEATRGNAERGRQLVGLLVQRGYGPRIGPEQVAGLTPDVKQMMAIVAATQEEAEQPKSDKRGRSNKRRTLTDHDAMGIAQLHDLGWDADAISKRLGIAVSSVERYLGELRDRVGQSGRGGQ